MPSYVYFIDAKIENKTGLVSKLEELFRLVSPKVEEEIVAIKVHMGEYGNTRYIRPIFIRKLVDLVKLYGGKPFITDTTTLYHYKRHSLFDYLETAASNGFSSTTMNCPIIIADGLKDNGSKVNVVYAYRLSEIKVAQAIYDADYLISAAHFTYHPYLTPAANIKNIAMGCVTRESKFKMHSYNALPKIEMKNCSSCKICIKHCPQGAISQQDNLIKIIDKLCIRCGICISVCKSGAIKVPWNAIEIEDIQKAIIDSLRAVLSTFKGNKLFFINFALDITEHCDCLNRADLPVIKDIGILASEDILALDKATYDLAKHSKAYPDSSWQEKLQKELPTEALIDEEKIAKFFKLALQAKIGNLEYELIKI